MTARAILQGYLDTVAAAVMQQDYATYRRHVMLPFHLVTHAANITIDTEDALRDGFDRFADTLRSQRITDYIRLVADAQAIDAALITGHYVTHMMAGGHRLLPPFTSHITLRADDGHWRAASITNALANSRWPILMPSLPPTDDPKGPNR